MKKLTRFAQVYRLIKLHEKKVASKKLVKEIETELRRIDAKWRGVGI